MSNSDMREVRSKKAPREFLTWVVVLSATFFLVAGAIRLWDWIGPPAWRPRIACAAAEFDFGKRLASETVDHEFEIANTGSNELVITNVQADCSCVAIKVTDTTIPPGFSLALPVRITLSQERSGDVLRHVVVESNDPITPHLMITLRGHISDRGDSAK
jgi:hypothetical protein